MPPFDVRLSFKGNIETTTVNASESTDALIEAARRLHGLEQPHLIIRGVRLQAGLPLGESFLVKMLQSEAVLVVEAPPKASYAGNGAPRKRLGGWGADPPLKSRPTPINAPGKATGEAVGGMMGKAAGEGTAEGRQRQDLVVEVGRLKAERDTALRERDAALRERDAALRERDEALGKKKPSPPSGTAVPAQAVTDVMAAAREAAAAAAALKAEAPQLRVAAAAEAARIMSSARDDSRTIRSKAVSDADEIASGASGQARLLRGEAVSMVCEPRRVAREASRARDGISRKVAKLQADQAAAQAEFDETFFLNFGRRGELGETIESIRADIKAEIEALEEASKAAERAERELEEAEERAAGLSESADQMEAEASARAADATASAEKFAADVVERGEEQATAASEQGEIKAVAAEQEAARLTEKAAQLRRSLPGW
jgi:hypothetical protein